VGDDGIVERPSPAQTAISDVGALHSRSGGSIDPGRLSVGFTVNPRLQPLLDGSVRFETFEPDWELMPHNELFLRQQTADDLDVFELSIDRLLTTRGPAG
jgi:hypothetical protein